MDNSAYEINVAELMTTKISLNVNQILTWQEAYKKSKLPEPEYISFGNVPETKSGKEFLKPFIKAGYIDANHLKYCGIFRLTNKGIMKFEELLKTL